MSLLNLFQAAPAAPQLKPGFKRSATSKIWAAVLGATALTLVSSSVQAASFAGLGGLPNGSFSSGAFGVSADGSVVVGRSNGANGGEAFRWTNTDGMVGLGDLPGGRFSSGALGVSADGSVVVGSGSAPIRREAFRWTEADGMVGLGDLPGLGFFSEARDVSADSSAVVGSSLGNDGIEAFRWTEVDGMVGLGDLPGGRFDSDAWGVSADGSVVVGFSESASGREAFRWTEADGMVGLGDLPGGRFFSIARDVSADGSVVVGRSDTSNSTVAFRWTEADGMVRLSDLPGSDAWGVSADGSIVVGSRRSEAFRWTESDGMRNLSNILTDDFGLDLSGWRLHTAADISADGLTIVGIGTNPDGRQEAWIAQLDPFPGSSQDNPILPDRVELVDDPRFVFIEVPRGQWYDPPAAFGFEYTMTSDSLFTQILDFPIGIDTDDLFTVMVGDTVLGEFGAGQSVDFTALLGGGVSSFRITDIDPLVDGNDPTAFPLKLDFNTETASFEMRALTATSTPEPSTLLGLGTLALAGGTLLRRKRKA